jgi:hypothetical protein
MRKSDFKKGTLIEIPSSDGRFAYAQVLEEADEFAPLLALLDGIFQESLTFEKLIELNLQFKKHAYVNSTGSKNYPSVWTWKVLRKEYHILPNIPYPKATVHGDPISLWKVVYPDGETTVLEDNGFDETYFEKLGFCMKTMWRAPNIENYLFENKALKFPFRYPPNK